MNKFRSVFSSDDDEMHTRTRPVQKRVEETIAAGKCLVHGCDRRHDEPGGADGRCSKHFNQLGRELMNLPRRKKLLIRERHEREGTLLIPYEIRKYPKNEAATS